MHHDAGNLRHVRLQRRGRDSLTADLLRIHDPGTARPHELRLRRLGAGWGDDEVRAQLFPLLALVGSSKHAHFAAALPE